MTWPEIDDLDRRKSIVFLPLGPIEEHGPHLPTGTDFFAVMDIIRLSISRLNQTEPDLNFLLHPGIPLGCTPITQDFPGTISLRGSTLVKVIYDVAASFARHGFRYLIIVNHHYDLYHMKALSVAMDKVGKEYKIALYEPLGTAFFASQPEMAMPLTDQPEFNLDREGHAEFEETSFIYFQHPDLLKGTWRNLPPVYCDPAKQFLLGRRTLKKMGATLGYIGTPANANPEYGRSYLEVQSCKVADTALKLYRGEDLPQMPLKIRLAMKLLRLS